MSLLIIFAIGYVFGMVGGAGLAYFLLTSERHRRGGSDAR